MWVDAGKGVTKTRASAAGTNLHTLLDTQAPDLLHQQENLVPPCLDAAPDLTQLHVFEVLRRGVWWRTRQEVHPPQHVAEVAVHTTHNTTHICRRQRWLYRTLTESLLSITQKFCSCSSAVDELWKDTEVTALHDVVHCSE